MTLPHVGKGGNCKVNARLYHYAVQAHKNTETNTRNYTDKKRANNTPPKVFICPNASCLLFVMDSKMYNMKNKR